MDTTKSQSAFNRVYEDFEPDFQWQIDQTAATLTVHLPGFRRDQVKVQITSNRLVKIIGERQISDNKWCRITKQLSIPSECDTKDVTAKFERNKLFIKFSIKPSMPREEDKAKAEAEAEAKPSNGVSEPQKKEEEEEGDQREETKKKKKVTTSGVVENIPPLPPTSEAITSKNHGDNLGLIKRTKTRVLDYTISLKPSLESEDLKKPKNWVNFMLLVLFVAVLVIYVKQAFRSFLGVMSKLQG